MTDGLIVREPWDDETLPADLDARRVYEHAVEVGGERRQRRHRRRNAGLLLLVAAVALPAGATLANRHPKSVVRVAAPSGRGERVSSDEHVHAPVFTKYAGSGIAGPEQITAGPDGAMWFANFSGAGSIGRITSTGAVSTFTDPSISKPTSIAVGPDGALWFTNSGSIGRITTTGDVRNYIDPSISGPGGIVSGPDGALWFTNHDNNSIGRITTNGAVRNYTDPSISGPQAITVGPDGALWFTNFDTPGSIGRITTTGVISNYPDPGLRFPNSITPGPDGALWFTDYVGNTIGRITTAGTINYFRDNSILSPQAITLGPDGALWFTNADSIGRITTAGTVSHFTGPDLTGPQGIAVGPDGAFWFTNFGQPGSIGRMTVPPPGYLATTTTVPSITDFPRTDPCPTDCIGRTTADVDGDGKPDEIGLMGTPKPPLNMENVTGVKLVIRVVLADGRTSDYHDTAAWDASLVGAADVNGDGRAEIFYFNDTGASHHMGHILQWDGSELVAVQGSDGKPFTTFIDGYAMGGRGFRCRGDAFIATTIQFGGPPDGWVGDETTYHWSGHQLLEVGQHQPIAIADPLIGTTGDFNVPPEYDQIIGVHCPGLPNNSY